MNIHIHIYVILYLLVNKLSFLDDNVKKYVIKKL